MNPSSLFETTKNILAVAMLLVIAVSTLVFSLKEFHLDPYSSMLKSRHSESLVRDIEKILSDFQEKEGRLPSTWDEFLQFASDKDQSPPMTCQATLAGARRKITLNSSPLYGCSLKVRGIDGATSTEVKCNH
jgi:hypothetical protein